MSDPLVRLHAPQQVQRQVPFAPLGQHLLSAGLISEAALRAALRDQRKQHAALGDILVAKGELQRADLYAALAAQFSVDFVDLSAAPASESVRRSLPAALCVTHQVAPYRWLGDTLLVATHQPQKFDQVRAAAAALDLRVLPVIALPDHIKTRIHTLFGALLAQRAMIRTPDALSCRSWSRRRPHRAVAVATIAAPIALGLGVWPVQAIVALSFLAVALLVLATGLKLAAFLALQRPQPAPPAPAASLQRLPRISVMVPLFKETEIAEALVRRLQALSYPKALLEVVLVLEAQDRQTRKTLAKTALPSWMTIVEVPHSDTITTKPRALNYALDFCSGDIIGVWDAEDAPAADQLEIVAAEFRKSAPNVACLQGKLDYYNSNANWMARCFTIEYATWWRCNLPGIERLGLVLPLGGTTLFFRRAALERLGAWDAHNVTEDADLGVRLARKGMTTRLIDTVTHEEATCRPWPWVRQRSRWLKGFLVTYLVHMRAPRTLWRDLGPRRFWGLQVMLLVAVAQFLLAPVLLSFWPMMFGLSHPLSTALPPVALWVVLGLVILCEVTGLFVSYKALDRPSHRGLRPWVLTMPMYFTLGTLAAYKAMFELVVTPFFWDKTQHGVSHSTTT